MCGKRVLGDPTSPREIGSALLDADSVYKRVCVTLECIAMTSERLMHKFT